MADEVTGATKQGGGNVWTGPLQRLDEFRWCIPTSYKQGMKVPGVIYAAERQLPAIREDQAPEQVANTAFLPGIVGQSLAMPDIHWGYGFAIGGVAATSASKGVVSPGGVGFDINCGVRLVRTDLEESDVRQRLRELVDALFSDVPSGVGSSGQIKLAPEGLAEVLRRGSRWAVDNGYGWEEDLRFTEDGGCIEHADPSRVSERAVKRGLPQLGTLGSGNHFLEVQVVEKVYDHDKARAMGVSEGQVTLLIHSGSRGLGHQVCTDYLEVMEKAVREYGIRLPDRQLACAPVDSPEGRAYLGAMACAANYAWANRQCIMHWARQAFADVFKRSPQKLGMRMVYDVAHNIAKIERYTVGGAEVDLCVHRKGATRAFPPFHPDLPPEYASAGQPVLVPGDMGRNSYLLAGTEKAMRETFGSTCHGAGRVKSRAQARKEAPGAELQKRLLDQGIYTRAADRGALGEEAPEAYKDVNQIVAVTHGAGISMRVARMRPMGVVKG